MQLVLLGDSILDNDIYVLDGKSVYSYLRNELPESCQLLKLAVDGYTSQDTINQLSYIPDSATHIVLSVGGNDALKLIPLLQTKINNIESALNKLVSIEKDFRKHYSALISKIVKTNAKLYVLNIYNEVPNLEEHKKIIISIFNDIISEEAAKRSIPLIDLRVLCSNKEDYSDISSLEPSEIGSNKIAREIINQLAK
jgi:lysophospholipase L1-like esterase